MSLSIDSLDSLVPPAPPSPIHSVLFRGDALSPAEVAEVRKAVGSAQQNMSRVTALESKLADLTHACANSRQENNRFILYHQPILRSARSLPADMWREIFEWYLATPKHTNKESNGQRAIFRSASGKVSPLVLTHVCSTWRTISIGLAALWSSIDFCIAQAFPKTLLPLLNMWLTRSARMPLTVTFRMTMPLTWVSCTPEVRGNIHTCLSMLASHSRRWKQVDFQVTVEIYRSSLFPIGTPILEKARLATQECLPHVPDRLTFFDPAPNLKHVELHNFVPHGETFSSMIPLGSLTSVTLGSFADKVRTKPGILTSFFDHRQDYSLHLCPRHRPPHKLSSSYRDASPLLSCPITLSTTDPPCQPNQHLHPVKGHFLAGKHHHPFVAAVRDLASDGCRYEHVDGVHPSFTIATYHPGRWRPYLPHAP